MSERQLQDAIVELARRLGFRVAHFRPAQVRAGRYATPVGYDAAGFPDLVLAREGRVLFIEVKAAGRKPRADQLAWLHDLACDCAPADEPCAHPGVLVLQPKDWHSGQVEALLR